jgi:hypothetical protein
LPPVPAALSEPPHPAAVKATTAKSEAKTFEDNFNLDTLNLPGKDFSGRGSVEVVTCFVNKLVEKLEGGIALHFSRRDPGPIFPEYREFQQRFWSIATSSGSTRLGSGLATGANWLRAAFAGRGLTGD